MSLILHLGVIDLPYSKAPTESGKPGAGGTQTTFDVATWLEDKYGVMQVFADMQLPAIAFALEDALGGQLESLMMGAPAASDPFAGATAEIEHMFRTFLDENEVAAAGVPGTPTAASLKGVNHRKKQKRGAPRPSFIDTGLYQASFKAFFDI